MTAPYAPQALATLGRQWVEAWNSRDLERVLTMYAEDAEMTSDRIPPRSASAPAEPFAARTACAPIRARR
jgi:ketosteroid isomerase-like protein